MLNVVIGLFETIKNIGYLSILLSYRTGQIIVNGILTSLDVLYKVYDTLWTVLVILNEDLFVFLSDVGSRLSFIVGSTVTFIEYVGESVISFFTFLKSMVFGASYFVITTVQTVIDVITKVFSSFGSLMAGIKQLVVLLGGGVWFAITLVPVFIIYVCMMTTYYIGRAFDETKSMLLSTVTQIKTGLLDLIAFVTDVPVESFLGLVVICCLIYVLVKFHITVYGVLSRSTALMLSSLNRNVARIRSSVFPQRRRPVVVVESETSSDSDTSAAEDASVQEEIPVSKNIGWRTKKQRNKELMEEDNSLCVICMERNKCMLSMPCRHLCTCIECNNTLRLYQRTCPICRRYVNYTIHVY